jgi:hypothetical protein
MFVVIDEYLLDGVRNTSAYRVYMSREICIIGLLMMSGPDEIPNADNQQQG